MSVLFLKIFSLSLEFQIDSILFPFNALKMLFYYFLSYIVSDEKSSVILILCSSVYCVSFFLWLLTRFFSLSLMLCSLIVMCLDIAFIHISCARNPLTFLDLWVCSFYQIWKILSLFLHMYFLPPLNFRDSDYIHIRPLEVAQ